MDWKDYDYTGDIKYQEIKLTEGGKELGINLVVKNYLEEDSITYTYKKENDSLENTKTLTELLIDNPSLDNEKLSRVDKCLKSNDEVFNYLKEDNKIDLGKFNERGLTEDYINSINFINNTYSMSIPLKNNNIDLVQRMELYDEGYSIVKTFENINKENINGKYGDILKEKERIFRIKEEPLHQNVLGLFEEKLEGFLKNDVIKNLDKEKIEKIVEIKNESNEKLYPLYYKKEDVKIIKEALLNIPERDKNIEINKEIKKIEPKEKTRESLIKSISEKIKDSNFFKKLERVKEPFNASTKKEYKGINKHQLRMDDPRWLTVNNIKSAGLKIKENEEPTKNFEFRIYDIKEMKDLDIKKFNEMNSEEQVVKLKDVKIINQSVDLYNGSQIEGLPQLKEISIPVQEEEKVFKAINEIVKNSNEHLKEMVYENNPTCIENIQDTSTRGIIDKYINNSATALLTKELKLDIKDDFYDKKGLELLSKEIEKNPKIINEMEKRITNVKEHIKENILELGKEKKIDKVLSR